MTRAALDPVSYEVIRNRLVAITDEMRVALQSVSGSPTVTDASDFFTGLFLPDGPFISMGNGGAFSSAPARAARPLDPRRPATTVRDGDMFIGNDPFIAALHQNDVQMIVPDLLRRRARRLGRRHGPRDRRRRDGLRKLVAAGARDLPGGPPASGA